MDGNLLLDQPLQDVDTLAAVAHGRWKLEGREGTPWGLYTLVLRKMGSEWKIVSDTTTSAE